MHGWRIGQNPKICCTTTCFYLKLVIEFSYSVLNFADISLGMVELYEPWPNTATLR